MAVASVQEFGSRFQLADNDESSRSYFSRSLGLISAQSNHSRQRRAAIYQSADPREVAVPSPARAQPSRLVSVGKGSVRQSEKGEQTDLSLSRLFHLSLVSRDGARVVRERRDCKTDERQLRQHQSGPRRTA